MRYFGYIDAGTGSMLIQAVLGTVLAGVVIFRNVFRKIVSKAKFKSTPSQATKDEEV